MDETQEYTCRDCNTVGSVRNMAYLLCSICDEPTCTACADLSIFNRRRCKRCVAKARGQIPAEFRCVECNCKMSAQAQFAPCENLFCDGCADLKRQPACRLRHSCAGHYAKYRLFRETRWSTPDKERVVLWCRVKPGSLVVDRKGNLLVRLWTLLDGPPGTSLGALVLGDDAFVPGAVVSIANEHEVVPVEAFDEENATWLRRDKTEPVETATASEPKDDDANEELDAMRVISEALGQLGPYSKARVMAWASLFFQEATVNEILNKEKKHDC